MKIGTRLQYGLRAMIELALQSEGEPVMTHRIAECSQIPCKYLENLLGTLRQAALIRSVRGSRGGFVLARPPAEITAWDIAAALEDVGALLDCQKDPKNCDLWSTCPTFDLWQEMAFAIRAVLEQHTLEDLARRAREKKTFAGYMYYI